MDMSTFTVTHVWQSLVEGKGWVTLSVDHKFRVNAYTKDEAVAQFYRTRYGASPVADEKYPYRYLITSIRKSPKRG